MTTSSGDLALMGCTSRNFQNNIVAARIMGQVTRHQIKPRALPAFHVMPINSMGAEKEERGTGGKERRRGEERRGRVEGERTNKLLGGGRKNKNGTEK